jgi:hypothetical protein
VSHEIKCRQCDYRHETETDTEASAWAVALEHAGKHKGHIVETYVDGTLSSSCESLDPRYRRGLGGPVDGL